MVIEDTTRVLFSILKNCDLL